MACDLPVHDEIVNSFSKEKCWTNDKNTGAKFPLRSSVIKHWEHLRIVILFSKVVSYHEEDVNITDFSVSLSGVPSTQGKRCEDYESA